MEDREKWWKMGMKAIAEGKLGVLLLSGGQVMLSKISGFLTFKHSCAPFLLLVGPAENVKLSKIWWLTLIS